MSIWFGNCPSCGTALPARLKDKTQCINCKKYIHSDLKKVPRGALFLMMVTAVVAMTDWRLAILLAAPVAIILLIKMKYKIVDE